MTGSWSLTSSRLRLATFSINSEKLRSVEIYHLVTEAAVSFDPATNRIGIESHQGSRRRLVDDLKSQKSAVGRMETKNRPRREANPLIRHDAKHHRASGRT